VKAKQITGTMHDSYPSASPYTMLVAAFPPSRQFTMRSSTGDHVLEVHTSVTSPMMSPLTHPESAA